MKSEIERYKEAVELARNELFALATLGGITSIGNVQAKETLAKINAILNPPVEMEEVETSAFRCPSCMRLHETDKNDCTCATYCSEFIKLTGTLTRPKPVKVERSVDGQFQLDGSFRSDAIIKTLHYGKSGTFTWTE